MPTGKDRKVKELTEEEINRKLKQIKKYMENKKKKTEDLERRIEMNNSVPESEEMNRQLVVMDPINDNDIVLKEKSSPAPAPAPAATTSATTSAATTSAASGFGNTPVNLSSTNCGEKCCECIGGICQCVGACLGALCNGGKKNRKSKTKKFKKHYMWNTKGKRYMAKTHKQHMRGVKLGHTHKKPKKSKRRTKKRGGNPFDMSSLRATLPSTVTWGTHRV